MDADLEWKDLDTLDPESRSKVTSAIERLVSGHPDATMDHDLAWLSANGGEGKSVKVFVCVSSQGTLLGYAPFFVHPSALSVELFGISLFDYPVRRYSISAGPLLAADYAAPRALLGSLLLQVRNSLGRRDVAFGLGVELGSVFGQAIFDNVELRKTYRLLPHGKQYRRRLIVLPEQFEEYVTGLGKSTRYDVRRAMRRFESTPGLSGSFRIFSTPEEVPEFLGLAEAVSNKTYQRKLLDIGISDNAASRRALTLAAEKGWLRSLIVFVEGEPAAFKHGFVYKGTYFSHLVGYDPHWAGYAVGMMSYMYAVRDQIGIGTKKFDFMYGDQGNKERLSNYYREEQNVYLIPRRFPLSQIACALQIFNSASESLGTLMEKYHLKSRIRRFLRHRSTSRP